jgi:hypothetical protein
MDTSSLLMLSSDLLFSGSTCCVDSIFGDLVEYQVEIE